jgi:hypothetical protein
MIARFLQCSHSTAYTASDQAVPESRTEEEVIDAEARIPRKGVSPVLPEGVDALFRVQLPDRIDPPLSKKPLVGLPYFGAKQGVIAPALRRVDVEVRRYDVEVARQNDPAAPRKEVSRAGLQPVQPTQLKVEFGPRRRVPVWQIKAADDKAPNLRFNVAAMEIVRIAGQAAAGLLR